MKNGRPLEIEGRVYWKNPDVDRYQLRREELGQLRMIDIPGHSHLEIIDLPEPADLCEMEVYALNGGDDKEPDYLSVYGGGTFRVPEEERLSILSRIRRAFPDLDPQQQEFLRNPHITTEQASDGEILANVFLNVDFSKRPTTLVYDAVAPFADGFRRMDRASAKVFICHASEDKAAARELASALTVLGAEVWLDEWEIKVGDSIVQKIDEALGVASHLVVLLSVASVTKPWVQKELSSALMRQLSAESVRVLPVRLDDCAVPPILSDLKYADARTGIQDVLPQLEEALFEGPPA